MSTKQCDTGNSTSGFPLNISQSLFVLASSSESDSQLQKAIVPTEFSVNWGSPMLNMPIIVTQTADTPNSRAVCQITGIDNITANSTINWGNATYKCSNTLSIVKNQHKNFNTNNDALYEVILSFQIIDKITNPSLPDIILLTRPLVFVTETPGTPGIPDTPDFWKTVNTILSTSNANTNTNLDMSTMFGYNDGTLMPMVSYQTCLPVKIINPVGTTPVASLGSFLGSLTMRVNVIINPIYISVTENGLGKCSVVTKYTLVTVGRGPVELFNDIIQTNNIGNHTFQFKDGGNTADKFPLSATLNNFVPLPNTYSLTTLSEILQKVEIAVPDFLLGNSLNKIANSKTLLPVLSQKKKFKCYTIDPTTDIVGDQITIDPTTGKSLTDTLENDALNDSGGLYLQGGILADAASAAQADSGIKPGDIEYILVIIFITFSSACLFGYMYFIGEKIFFKEPNEQIPWGHIICFCLLLISLIVLSVYMDPDKHGNFNKPKSNDS